MGDVARGSSDLTQDQIDATQGVASFVSALSVLGSCFIVLCFARFKHLRKLAFRLVALLSLTDVLNQLFDFVGPSAAELAAIRAGQAPVSGACLAQALGNSFLELSSVMWTTTIAYTLYLFVALRLSPEAVERRFPLMLAWAVGFPLAMALLPLADNAYGAAGAWCWVRPEKAAWGFVQFYVPLWSAMLFNAAVYCKTYALLRSTINAGANSGSVGGGGGSAAAAAAAAANSGGAGVARAGGAGGGIDASSGGAGGVPASALAAAANDETQAKLSRILQRMQVYPFILVAVWLFASVNRVYEAASGGHQVFALFFLQRVFSSSQGLLNALAYGFSDGVREAVRAELAAALPRYFAPAPPPAPAPRGAELAKFAGGAGAGGASAGDRDSIVEAQEDVDDQDINVAVRPPAAVEIVQQLSKAADRKDRVEQLRG